MFIIKDKVKTYFITLSFSLDLFNILKYDDIYKYTIKIIDKTSDTLLEMKSNISNSPCTKIGKVML